MRLTLSRKLAILILIILIPLVGIIVYDTIHFLNEEQLDALRDHQVDAELVGGRMNRFAHELAEEGVTAGVAIVENDLGPDEAERYLKAVQGHIPISNLFFIDTEGKVIASSQSGLRGDDLSEEPAFQSARAGAALAVTGLRKNANGKPGFAVFAGVREDDRLAAVMGVSVDTDSLPQILPSTQIAGRTMILTDQNGRLIFSNDRSLNSLSAARRDLSSFEFVADPLDGRVFRSLSTPLPYQEGRFLGAQVSVSELEWTTGFFSARASILRHIYEDAGITIVVVTIVVFASALGAFIYGRGIGRPVQELAKASEEIGKGNFDVPIEVRTQDEIGILAENFRTMQESLKRTFGDVGSLNTAARLVNSSLETEAVKAIALDYVSRILNAESVVMTTEFEAEPVVVSRHIDEAQARRLSRVIPEMVDTRLALEQGYALFPLTGIADLGMGFDASLLVVLPLVVKGKTIGRIDALASPRRSLVEFERADVGLAVGFAQQVAVALENARLFEEQRKVADTLQDSLLTEPPYIPGLDIGLTYRPTTSGARIGGDFYDVIPIAEGRAVIVLGDISGKGIEAARFTSISKGAIRSFALENHEPHSVLERANKVISEQTGPETFITAVYFDIDVRKGTVGYAVAGHPSPLLYSKRMDKVVRLGGRGMPLGALLEEFFSGMQATLSEGDKLVVFTDGLTEARRDSELFSEDRIIEAVYELKHLPVGELVDRLAEKAVDFSGGNLTDDLAIVAVELKPRRLAEAA
ncbi:MAG: SpoIIE family protein phosphatase [Candidatus Aquicultorales bacterium]